MDSLGIYLRRRKSNRGARSGAAVGVIDTRTFKRCTKPKPAVRG
jgi:hypothetical protein